MERNKVIELANGLGWRVEDLNDNPHGWQVNGASWQVLPPEAHQDTPTGIPNKLNEEDAWNHIHHVLTGEMLPPSNKTWYAASQLVDEMMEFEHPSLVYNKGNSYTWVEAWSQVENKTKFTFNVGIQYQLSNTGLPTYKVFSQDAEGRSDYHRTLAVYNVYDEFKEWINNIK